MKDKNGKPILPGCGIRYEHDDKYITGTVRLINGEVQTILVQDSNCSIPGANLLLSNFYEHELEVID